jgi:cellulose synthase/poly-beta-1,6-N-acetylglucosamine synthase-like glycosyltransferase/spore germination protein YaaH/peptidoglycan/xylan/chitin deacetylase (PgdA/CDA1 family)
MMANESQIFQTDHPGRWQRFKWGGRLFLFLLLIALVVLVVTIGNISKDNPSIPLEGKAIKKALTSDIPAYRESDLGKQYRGMRKYIQNQWAKGKGIGQKNSTLDLSTSPFFSDSLGIRAAFYVAWDPQSYTSLLKNISKINLVLPEWLFIDPTSDTLLNTIDKYALDLIKKSNVKVMPLLSNNYKSQFNGAALHRILSSKAKTSLLINEVINILKQYDFAGINVDFEEMKEEKNENLTNFQKELYRRLHAEGFLVSQNVSPFNEDYNYNQLANYNDYLFLMAYDQHSESTKPGPICSQKWIESAVDKLATQVPAQKIVLNLAAYGYDWSKGKKRTTAKPVSYQQALAFAKESESVIDFDNDTYNLHYLYYDDKDIEHEVHFTDAATNFNTIRFATESGLAGTALWRLGDEDSRLWDFYNRSMTKASLKNFNFNEFANVEGGSEPNFFGEGEILDIIASPTDGHITSELDSVSMLISEEKYDKLPSTYVIKRWGKTSEKKLVLTYDDGPDPRYTKEILDTLAYYHVPASFFLVGIEAENNIPLVKRLYREGYEIGNHTFTHPNMAEVSKQRALLEMDATRLLIECITGHSTIMFRAPYNADSEPGKSEELVPIALSRTRNYITIGESIDPEDWQQTEIKGFNADTIFNRVVNIYNYHVNELDDSASIILLHDAGGNRSATVQATGKIIRYFQARGYKFTTIADLLGKKRDDLMPAVPLGSGYRLLQFNAFLFEIGYVFGHFVNALFIVFLSISALRLIILIVFAFLQKRKEKTLNFIPQTDHPLVSIIVPAYNEEVNAVKSLENLLLCNYPSFEIIFVDDGSKDNTYEKVKAVFETHPLVKIFTKENGGKSSALNFGINKTIANFVVCIDADTKLLPNAVSELMRSFADEKVGAVAGIVKVGNEVNTLTKWQSIEYISSQNFDRKGFAYINAITVVPGAIGAFKRNALLSSGGFTTDTLAEDCDLSIRILKAGYIIANQPKAIAYTEAPESLNQFMKQRFRWSFGVMQTFWKHKEALFNIKYKALGWVALPDILVFKYLIPLFSPLADFFMLLGLLSETRGKIGIYYLIFLAVDALIAGIAFAFDHEKPWKLIWLIPQRLIYRWIMLVVLFRSFNRAIKGELQFWGVLKRTGNVKDVTVVS